MSLLNNKEIKLLLFGSDNCIFCGEKHKTCHSKDFDVNNEDENFTYYIRNEDWFFQIIIGTPNLKKFIVFQFTTSPNSIEEDPLSFKIFNFFLAKDRKTLNNVSANSIYDIFNRTYLLKEINLDLEIKELSLKFFQDVVNDIKKQEFYL